jgi:phenylacetate-CoA ligase
LHAYPSAAERFASLCTQENVRPPRFRALLLGSEACPTPLRDRLESAFGAKVFSWYGQTEKVLLGGECARSSRYHLFEDYGYAEIVDDDGNEIKEPGTVGRLLGTGFLNTGAPMLRYDTGDLASWGPPCECGWKGRTLAALHGRAQDALVTGAGTRVSVAALELHAPEYAHIRRMQFEQVAAGSVRVRVVAAEEWSTDMGRRLVERLSRRLPDTVIDVVLVDSVEPDANGKTPLVKRS